MRRRLRSPDLCRLMTKRKPPDMSKRNYYIKLLVSLSPEEIIPFVNKMITIKGAELICFERARWTE